MSHALGEPARGPIRRTAALFGLLLAVAFAACQASPPGSSTTPLEEANATPCESKFQATHAYVSFAIEPDPQGFGLGALAAEEIISSLRRTGCDPRPDLREHAALVDALRGGALIISAITFTAPLPHAAEVIASEAKYGDASAPGARSFSIRVRRAREFTAADAAEGAPETTVEAWRITSISLR